MEVESVVRQNDNTLNLLHVLSMGILIIGFVGIVFNLMISPDRFPVVSLFITAIGAMLAVAVSTKYLIWQQYKK